MHLLLCILDVDECATNNGGCSIHAMCTNTVGSRTCKCKAGYSGDGVTCNGMRVVKCLQGYGLSASSMGRHMYLRSEF